MKQLAACLLMCGLLLPGTSGLAQFDVLDSASPLPQGDPQRGRLVFAPCRTCHFTEAAAGHGNGPNLHRIFGKVAGKQPGFSHYSAPLREAQFVWTPKLLYAWLEAPMAAMPGTTMMSGGVPDAQQRADLIAYLQLLSVRNATD